MGVLEVFAKWQLVVLVPALSTTLWCCAVQAEGVLHGNVQHDEKVKPISEEYREGNRLALGSLEASSESNEWFPIPHWLAGTWTCVQQVRTLLQEEFSAIDDQSLKVMKATDRETFGWQRDERGQIWTCRSTGKALRTKEVEEVEEVSEKVRREINWFRIRENSLKSESNDVVTLKTKETLIKTDLASSKVIAVEQSKGVRSLHWLGDDVMVVCSDSQFYDEDGERTRRVKSVSIYRKVKEFSKVDELGGRNLHASFVSYLRKTGQISLIPARDKAE